MGVVVYFWGRRRDTSCVDHSGLPPEELECSELELMLPPTEVLALRRQVAAEPRGSVTEAPGPAAPRTGWMSWPRALYGLCLFTRNALSCFKVFRLQRDEFQAAFFLLPACSHLFDTAPCIIIGSEGLLAHKYWDNLLKNLIFGFFLNDFFCNAYFEGSSCIPPRSYHRL